MENVVPDEEEQPDRFLSGLASLTEFGRALGQAQSNQVRNTDRNSCDLAFLDPVLRIRIRDPGSGAFLTTGSGMGRKSASGSGIRDEQPGSYFLELRNNFFGFFGG